MNMNWLNTNYILRAGVLSVLLLLPGLISATCKADTIINSYKDDSLRFIIKDDSIITFRTGDSIFTIIRADSVLPVTPKQVKHSRYDNRIHRSAVTGTDYPDALQNTVCRKHGITFFRYGMGLRET